MKKPSPSEAAVALAYSAEQPAPQVIAKGRGVIAEAIIREARAHGIYVHESRELVSLLMQVDLDQHIPPQLYRAVAELLAWLYRMENRKINPLAPSGEPGRDWQEADLSSPGAHVLRSGDSR